jgi:type I restriction enzyme S subunit
VKAGWTTRTLGDLLSVQNGYAFDSKLFGAEGYPLIRIRDIKEGITTETKFSGSFDSKYVVNAGDFLIGMDGEFGCHEWKGPPALLNQRVCRLQGFHNSLEPRFLLHGINAHLKAIEEVTGYTTVKHLSSKQILAIEMLVPPRSEQHRIVTLLDEAFADIATAKANAEKNLQNARALFISHLQSGYQQQGAGWTTSRIADIAKHSLGKMLDKAKNRGDLKPYLRNLNVRWFDFDLSDVQEMKFTPEESGKYTAIKGDVLICEGGYPGRCAIWEDNEPIYFQKALHRVRFHNPLHSKWFVNYLYLMDQTGDLKNHFSGTGIQHFTGEALAKFTLPIPPDKQIQQVLGKANQLEAEVVHLESIYRQKLTALDDLKKSLLHQAFSGFL